MFFQFLISPSIASCSHPWILQLFVEMLELCQLNVFLVHFVWQYRAIDQIPSRFVHFYPHFWLKGWVLVRHWATGIRLDTWFTFWKIATDECWWIIHQGWLWMIQCVFCCSQKIVRKARFKRRLLFVFQHCYVSSVEFNVTVLELNSFVAPLCLRYMWVIPKRIVMHVHV